MKCCRIFESFRFSEGSAYRKFMITENYPIFGGSDIQKCPSGEVLLYLQEKYETSNNA